MSFDFKSLLTVDQVKNVLNQQLQQFAVQGLSHQLNKLVIEKNANSDNTEETEKALAEADRNIELLSVAIEVYSNELESLPVSEVVSE